MVTSDTFVATGEYASLSGSHVAERLRAAARGISRMIRNASLHGPVAAIRISAPELLVSDYLNAAAELEAKNAEIAHLRSVLRINEPAIKNTWFKALGSVTPREFEVLKLIAAGQSNKEAGRELGISPRTIEVHRARIMDKLGARNTADLMRIVLTQQVS